MLKYLKIEDLSDYIQQYDLAKFPIEKAVYLKQLIVDYCMDDFEIVEQLLKRTYTKFNNFYNMCSR